MKINQKDKVIVQEVISDKKGKKNKKDKKISKKNKLEDFIPKNKQKSLIIDSQLQEMTNLNDKDVKIEKITENFSKSLEINQIEKTDEKIKETQLENKEIPSENAKEQKEIKEETKNPLAEDAIKEEENEDEIEEELERQRLKEEENNEKNPQNIINLEKIEWNCLVGNPLSEGS